MSALCCSVLASAALVSQPSPPINAACPSAAVRILAVENFYASLVNQIGGQCVTTTTVLSDPDADFSNKIVATLSTPPAIIRAGDVVGLQVGANPHVWYSAAYVDQIRAAILEGLKQISPGASSYFDAQSAALDHAFATYRSRIGQINAQFAGVAVGSTESIFVDMAYSTGLNLISPPELMQAVSEGNDPSARDVARFEDEISGHRINVLVYNTQTVTSLTEQLKALAQDNNIPIVGVSETMPLGQTFQDWQADQLQLLIQALQNAAAAS